MLKLKRINLGTQRRKTSIKRRLSRCNKFIMCMACTLSMLAAGLNVGAEQLTDELRKQMDGETILIAEELERQWKQEEADLKNMAAKKGWDYELTMATFDAYGNPFSDMNYINIMSMYAAVKNFCNNQGRTTGGGLSSVPFITMSVQEKTLTRTENVLETEYKETSDGNFIPAGNIVISKETKVPNYVETYPGSGLYRKTGEKTVKPKTKTVKYGAATLNTISIESIPTYFGLKYADIKKDYVRRQDIMTGKADAAVLAQNVFLMTRGSVSDEALCPVSTADLANIIKDAGEKSPLLSTALSLIGQVPYEWGGKAKKAGLDSTWWTFDASNHQKGLDCSGFVQWAYMTAGYGKTVTDCLLSTGTMLTNLQDIGAGDLMPGDIGILNHGETTNHCGIYLGNGWWIHCSSGKKTVVVSSYPFQIFKRVAPQQEGEIDKITLMVYNDQQDEFKDVSNNDVLTLAKLIEHEAGNQGYNGWVAVAEVVRNRVDSTKFPNTVPGVIFQGGQFTNSKSIGNINPRPEIIQVARDVLSGATKIFNNPAVLYFRNPSYAGFKASTPVNWGTHQYFMCVNDHAFYLG